MKSYIWWRNKTQQQFKSYHVRIQKRSIEKLQKKIQNSVRALNNRKGYAIKWTFKKVSKLVIKALLNQECMYCLKLLKWNNFSLDHIRSVKQKGKNIEKNVHVICRQCNRRKGNMSHKAFVAILDVAQKYPRSYKDLMRRLAYGGQFYSFHKNKKG